MYIKDVYLNSKIAPDSYLSKISAVRHLIEGNKITFSANVTMFVGENGSGKSTLLEAIAVAYGFNPEGGTKNFRFSTRNSHSDLWEHITLSKINHAKDGFFLRAESLYNVATSIEKMSDDGLGTPIVQSYGGVSLHNQSHGEGFLAVVHNRFSGGGVYILDEPEAALSPMSILTLMSEIKWLEENESQFIIATHSPVLMAYPGADIMLLTDDGIKSVDYTETEHYQITKQMMTHPEGIFKHLF